MKLSKKIKRLSGLIITLITFNVLLPVASAHEISSGYLTIKQNSSEELSGQLSLRPYDFERLLNIDSNKNGELTWGEVKQHQTRIVVAVKEALTVLSGDHVCSLSTSPLANTIIGGQSLIAIPLSFKCDSNKEISINYQGFFELDESHKLLVSIDTRDITHSDVITASNRQITLDVQSTTTWHTFVTFVKEGVIHIWAGLDHILFLLATLLTVNLVRYNHKWIAEHKIIVVCKETLYLVTAFTVAHSITLTATALGWIQPNSRYVELGIAISVLLTALNNIWPIVYRIGWITFAFGLLHGMGFASVFADLNAKQDNLVLTVGAFNVGVEIGQLVIVLVVLPLLIWVRKVNWYARFAMPATSSLIALTALNWAIQRW